jgi:hypothetical protein
MESQFEMSPEVAELRRAIQTGKQPLWKLAVEMLREGKTRKMGIQIREVGLIVSIHMVFGWQDIVVPLSTEKPYERIASYLRETRGLLKEFTLRKDGDGDGDINLIDPNDGEQEATMIPIGLVFVGQTPSGQWADEVICVAGDLRAMVSGENPETTLKGLQEVGFQWAHGRIRHLTSN